MKVRTSLNLSLAAIAIVLLIAAGLFYHEKSREIETAAKSHLTTMLMLRESVLRGYFESLRSEVILWSSQATVVDIMRRVKADFDRAGDQYNVAIGSAPIRSLGGAARDQTRATLDQRAAEFAAHHDYYDIFFIAENGQILFTVTKESDLGTNLLDGPYADSGLGRLFRALQSVEDPDQIVFEDFSAYLPSDNQPAAFMGSPVYSEGQRIGYYVVQIPPDPVNAIMQFSAGMGDTGETYLVGRDGLMRSDSRFFNASSILQTRVSGETTKRALEGEVGLAIVDDYRDVPVYSAFRPIDFEGTRWAVLAEQDVAEIQVPIADVFSAIAAGYLLLLGIAVMLRFMLLKAFIPAALGAFLGIAMLDSGDDA
jgi:methyl-accepting chemotaxis protein